ncbi:MAG: two-component sensor histidine kinase [Lachnospiraceae bacterium]|nr:two-component sensor histidine kinase [Lachnospiraceae bacterium]
MKKNINARLVGIAIIAIAATFIGITTIYYGLFQKQVRSDLAITAKILKDTHYFETVDKNIDDEIEAIDFTADITELRVTWIDADGNVIYDNDVTSKGLENHMDRPEIQAAFKEGVGESVRRSDTMGKDTFYYATLLNNGTVLRVATDATSIWSVFISVAPVILLILLLIILLCVYLSHILTRQLLQPIEKMADNLEDADYESPYKELEPFLETIKSQHADVLSAAKARQDFTANVSHELKTPITAISGYTELLEGGMVDESQKKHFYQEIRKSSNRLLSLINDIIRLSELDRTEGEMSFEEISLYDLARECAEDLAVNASAKNVSLSFEGEECTVIGNRDMLRELIENLVQNAIRYNNENGKVTVVVSNDERPTLMVKDNGIGIPASEQQRVFERFYRVDKSRSKATGGTGLGLAIVKHIVEIHDAKIELDSAPGVGTTMTVIF